MGLKLQFAGWLMALGMSAALVAPSLAQNHPNAKPARPPQPRPQQQRQAPRQERQQQQQQPRTQNERQNSGGNRPPNANTNRPATGTGANNNPNRPPSAYTPPPKRNFNELSPQDKQKVLQNYKNFQKLTPGQKQQQKEAAENWSKLTPEQKSHITNDVLPKWRQLPPDRQRAISQRLGVLKNMPESARNQHLNDPNFTRGMSEEDKATLKDLSHMHVGGAPEPPSE